MSGAGASKSETVPHNLDELLSDKHRRVWEQKFSRHLEDLDNKAKHAKLQWRVDLLAFCLALLDLKKVLNSELSLKKAKKTSRPRDDSTSSSSSSDDSSVPGDMENAQNRRREICERLNSQFFSPSSTKEIAIRSVDVRNQFVKLVSEQCSGSHPTRKPEKRLFELIDEVLNDPKVWPRLSTLCDKYLNTVLRDLDNKSSLRKAAEAILLSII